MVIASVGCGLSIRRALHSGSRLSKMGALIIIALLRSQESPCGALVCKTCHPKETARFLEIPMAHSLEAPKLRPNSSTIHSPSGSIIELLDRGGVMYHQLSERGLVAAYPVKYQLGSGKGGHAYLIAVGDYLIQSPGGWYSEAGWNIAPAFANKPLLDFDSPVDAKCLFCHADNAKFTDADGRRLSGSPIAAIGCDRCHGPTAEHVRHPTAKNIVNPAKLKGTARDSVCVQCHLAASRSTSMRLF
jgi:cytochrome c554/c'-like protein